jgi:hypothetical protein
MSRDEEARLIAEAEEAKRRLRHGIDKSKALVARYRTRLMLLKDTVRPSPAGNRLVAVPSGPRDRG